MVPSSIARLNSEFRSVQSVGSNALCAPSRRWHASPKCTHEGASEGFLVPIGRERRSAADHGSSTGRIEPRQARPLLEVVARRSADGGSCAGTVLHECPSFAYQPTRLRDREGFVSFVPKRQALMTRESDVFHETCMTSLVRWEATPMWVRFPPPALSRNTILLVGVTSTAHRAVRRSFWPQAGTRRRPPTASETTASVFRWSPSRPGVLRQSHSHSPNSRIDRAE